MRACLHVVGSSRLWDAIENGAIPVITDRRQYGVVPFQRLWRSMSLLVNDTSSPSAVAKQLKSLSKDAKGRWSELMDARTTGRPIVSWLHPQSVTLRAYVQLLVDRLNGMFCGPCIHNEQRKKTCSQSRCERHKCVWRLIHKSKGCALNADGTVIPFFGESWGKYTLQKCQAECEKVDECVAVDYEKPHRRCRLFRKACSKPLTEWFASYRLEIEKYHEHMMWDGKIHH